MGETIRLIINDANMLVAAGVAVVAGLVSFASPCVLPLVPGYLSFMTGLSGQDIASGGVKARGRVFLGSLLFVIGFAVPFTMLGFAVGALNVIERSSVAQLIMGTVVAVLGFLMARGRLMREVRVSDRAPKGGLLSAPVLGFVFGVGWTPCLGPAAGAIMTLSMNVSDGVSVRGAFLGFVYALGLGLPFIIFGLLFRRLSGTLDFLKRRARGLQIAGGSFLVGVGIMIATGWWNDLMMLLMPYITNFETVI